MRRCIYATGIGMCVGGAGHGACGGETSVCFLSEVAITTDIGRPLEVFSLLLHQFTQLYS